MLSKKKRQSRVRVARREEARGQCPEREVRAVLWRSGSRATAGPSVNSGERALLGLPGVRVS